MTAMKAKGASQPETTAYYRDLCEQMALTIHVYEKGADEQAATERTLRKRIAVLEASQAKRTQLVVDATLRKAGR